MSEDLDGMTEEELVTFLCIDCNVDTDKNGHYYILKHEVWALTGLVLGDDKMLCIPCCEARIGRRLNKEDLMDFPEINDNPLILELING